MYPTAGLEKTKKRTLELGDITGIKKLYPVNLLSESYYHYPKPTDFGIIL